MNLFEHIKSILSQNEKYCKDGKLFKNVIVEDALKVEQELLLLLLNDDKAIKHFFTEVNEVLVFDKVKFQRFVSNKNFLPNSYTAFKNKIGLTGNDEYLTEAKEIVLDFPYKDCVLEGGQTKEDQKRNEILWNTTLASEDIDKLLEPKALTNWKHISNDGEKVLQTLKFNDNYLFKGNNLLSLHSINKVYKGKIKLIYIDPPYNTGKDGFGYNDSFNHSTWLTFMKNRLEVAKDLLSEDGSLFVSLDDKEVHYLKVLLDEIFGRDNFISTIIWNSKYTVSNDAKYVSYQHENILFYAKNKEQFEIGLFDRTEEQNKSYKNRDNDPKGPWKATPIHAKSGNEKNNYSITLPNGYLWSPPKGRYPRYSQSRLLKIYEEGGLYFNKSGGVDKKTYLSEVKQGVTVGSVWDYKEVGHTHSNNEEIAEILGKGAFDNPKGTKLLYKIFKVANLKDGDKVLDFFAGSGTTGQAVLEYKKDFNIDISFILCEQMDYIKDVTSKRLLYSIKKNKSNSFVYSELAQSNNLLSKLLDSSNEQELYKVFNKIIDKYLLSYLVNDPIKITEMQELKELDFNSKKEFILNILDHNQLFISYLDIEDADYNFSVEDKLLTNKFYNL
jgi:adenine-specific DNA-methyltransferase